MIGVDSGAWEGEDVFFLLVKSLIKLSELMKKKGSYLSGF